MVKITFIVLYNCSLAFCTLFGLHRLILALIAFCSPNKDPKPVKRWFELPRVTIQLPVYNERFVIERLLNAVSKLDYPKTLLEIQILDDSTDETTEIARNITEELKSKEFNIKLIHRTNRTGYKAGALSHGLIEAEGEFIAVFDADFIPPADFIHRTIHYFSDDSIGMVQVRWGYDNPNDSLLTKLQTMIIDGHFIIDQVSRFSSGRFFNFNGSAGVWRKSTILGAGGWQADTLAEDLDLSYRAQLAGWRFVLLSEFEVAQELPRSINSFKQQQFRWSKGSLEVARKLLPQILKSSLPLTVKIEAFFHLIGTVAYAFVFLASIITLPSIYFRLSNNYSSKSFIELPLFIAGFGSVVLYFFVSQQRLYRDWFFRLRYFPFFIAAVAGFSLIHVKAFLEVVQNKKTPFIRTPKEGKQKNFSPNLSGYKVPFDFLLFAEWFMCIYLSGSLVLAVRYHINGTVIFLFLLIVGFYYVAFKSLTEFIKVTFGKNVIPCRKTTLISMDE